MYVSKYFEEHRRDYYDLLADVSYKDAWTPWIRFFLNGLCEQAQDAIDLGRDIVALRENIYGQLREFNSPSAFNLLDAIFAHPYFTPTSIRVISGVRTQQTILTLISKFEEARILQDMSPNRQRNKLYKFRSLIDLLDGRRHRNPPASRS